jgi:hypothetical protein
MKIDLTQAAERLTQAAPRVGDLEVSAPGFDLILSNGGYGAYNSQAVPFAALFLSDRDLLGQALDRLEATPVQA